MPRVYPHSEYTDANHEPGAGEWQALRGELVALLDQVESRYGRHEEQEPAMPGLAQRVRHLRDQVGAPEPGLRRREALRSVKRAVDRFSERDMAVQAAQDDDLTAAIAEIRSRQGAAAPLNLGRRASDLPDMRELGGLVESMSSRLERLEGELRSQRSDAGHVREVASQVEQLTHVVELLAGAVGETGQVKRLEAQIAALGAMIERAPKPDLSAINARLDDVSTTVGKLAELHAQQMEREIAREDHRRDEAQSDPMSKIAPAMKAIEKSVRNVYDRIDTIEHSVALSSGDFERLTTAMSAFTQALDEKGESPVLLMEHLDALAARLESASTGNGQVAALKSDIGALRDAVMQGMEPRFSALEEQIAALNGKVAPIDTGAVESQLKTLMARMDDAGAQIDNMARLYETGDERESLKGIEERIAGLIQSAEKAPDYESLAEMVAARTSEALSRSAAPANGFSDENMTALERRMTALFNTAGKDTAERLARLEATLAARQRQADTQDEDLLEAPISSAPGRPAPPMTVSAVEKAFLDEAYDQPGPASSKLDAILAGLTNDQHDAMPANPGDEAPLIDPGFKNEGPVRSALAAKTANAALAAPSRKTVAPQQPPAFDPGKAERPPRPMSSFAGDDTDPFSPPPPAPETPEPMAAPASSTSTFVAAARRAQRARQEQEPAGEANSLIGRAMARVRTKAADKAQEPSAELAVPMVDAPAPGQDEAPPRRRKMRKASEAPAAAEAGPGFFARHRRPLLLAATLIAVSMLTLNLVIQRSAPPPSDTSEMAPQPSPEAESSTPPQSDAQISTLSPRIIGMMDPVAVGSINPGAPMSFSKTAQIDPLPSKLLAYPDAPDPDTEHAETAGTEAQDITGSISAAATETLELFELPPDAVGPIGLRQAAARGDQQAQFEVAAIYTEGRAVEQDYAAAATWYERASARGFAPAQYRLGNLYEAGTGVEKDLTVAKLWYQRSAEAGNRMAMHNLAALYAGGQLGDQQFEQAAEWFSRAAALGMTDSQFNLGMLHARGLGVEQDFEQSYKWFSLAARNGDKDAAQARDDIAKSLSADAVSRINETLAGWMADPIDLLANFAPVGTWNKKFDPGETIISKDVVVRVQQALNKLGFDIGGADGVAGPKTSQAIEAFERGTGMSESGKINPRLLAVLGSQPV